MYANLSEIRRWSSVAGMATTIIALATMSASANADHQPHRFIRQVNTGPVWVPPVYRTEQRVISIPAAFEERPTRVWREPVYETRKVLVEIPAEVRRERVPTYDRRGRFLRYEIVERVVSPARKVWREERVLVSPGRYETVVERVCVRPESTRVVYEKVLIQPGYWQYPKPTPIYHGRYYSRGMRFDAQYRDSDDWRVNVRLGR